MAVCQHRGGVARYGRRALHSGNADRSAEGADAADLGEYARVPFARGHRMELDLPVEVQARDLVHHRVAGEQDEAWPLFECCNR